MPNNVTNFSGLQGFIAFVAFIDIATALRNYVERRSFMSGNEEFTDVKLIEGKTAIAVNKFGILR